MTPAGYPFSLLVLPETVYLLWSNTANVRTESSPAASEAAGKSKHSIAVGRGTGRSYVTSDDISSASVLGILPFVCMCP